MFRSSFLAISITILSVSIAAQNPTSNDTVQIGSFTGAKPFTSLDINSSPDQFQFLIVTDRTGGHRPGVFEDAIRKINLLQPEFVMSVGDLIEGYTEDTTILSAEWKEFDGFIDQLEMPFFYVPGNHDLTNKVMEKIYLKRFGRTYYHFIYKNVLFLCLNSEDQLRGAGKGTISKAQFEYIRSVLDTTTDVRYTFLFMHQPLWIQNDPKYWPQVEELLASRQHTVFAGHYHHYVKRTRNNGKYVMLATTGGGSQLRGAQFGEFDHVAWVTMQEDQPVMANLFLEGIWHEDVSTETSENYIAELLANQMIQIEPQFHSDSVFREKDFRIKLTNHQDIPLEVSIQEGFGWDVWLIVDEHEVKMAPNSVTWVDAQLLARDGHHDLFTFRPTPLNFLVSSELPGYGKISIPLEFHIQPHPKTFIAPTTTPMLIDGRLDDWPIMSGTFKTLTDNTVHYGISHDQEFMYLSARVWDDSLVVDTSQSMHRQDCIGLQIAFGPLRESAKSPVNANLIRATPALDEWPSRIICRDTLEGANMVCIADAEGYTLEMRVPIKMIDREQGGEWKHVRINWYVDDLDNPGDWQDIERSWWHESWGTSKEVLGSGFFFKADSK